MVSDSCSFLLILLLLLLLTPSTYSTHQILKGVIGTLVVGPWLGALEVRTGGSLSTTTVLLNTLTMTTIAADVVWCPYTVHYCDGDNRVDQED